MGVSWGLLGVSGVLWGVPGGLLGVLLPPVGSFWEAFGFHLGLFLDPGSLLEASWHEKSRISANSSPANRKSTKMLPGRPPKPDKIDPSRIQKSTFLLLNLDLVWGSMLAPFWRPLGCLLGSLGSSWVHLGCLWVPLGGLLGVSGGLLGTLGCLSDASWNLVGASWVLLGVSWGLLGVCWVLWGIPGGLLGAPGGSLGAL